MDIITTALANELMLAACLILIILLLICAYDLRSAFRELDRLDEEEQEEEQREWITLNMRKQ